MAARHGVNIDDRDGLSLNLGIWRVFDPWINPHLLYQQGYEIRHPQHRPLSIEYHFRQTIYRLVISLSRVYQRSRQYDRFLTDGGLAGPDPGLVFEIPEEAGIAADSVCHYLQLFIDDLARIIPFVFAEEGDEPDEPESFAALKRQLTNENLPVPQELHDLFAELDQNESWFSMGFRRVHGLRQRLTHYTSLVSFSAETRPGDRHMTSRVSLIAVGGGEEAIDFESTLKALLAGLCEWLDHLEQVLLPRLQQRLEQKEIYWDPGIEPIRTARLPRDGDALRERDNYMYLPLLSQCC